MKFILLDDHLLYSDAKRVVDDCCSAVFIGMGDDDYEVCIDLVYQSEDKAPPPYFIRKDIIRIDEHFYIGPTRYGHIYSLIFFIKLCDIHLLPDDLYKIILLNLDIILK